MSAKIIDSRSNKHTRRIMIEFYGNKPFSSVSSFLKADGYNISIEQIYSKKKIIAAPFI